MKLIDRKGMITHCRIAFKDMKTFKHEKAGQIISQVIRGVELKLNKRKIGIRRRERNRHFLCFKGTN